MQEGPGAKRALGGGKSRRACTTRPCGGGASTLTTTRTRTRILSGPDQAPLRGVQPKRMAWSTQARGAVASAASREPASSTACADPVRAVMGAPNVHAEASTRRGARRELQAPHRRQTSCTLPPCCERTRQCACQTSRGPPAGATTAGGWTGRATMPREAAQVRHVESAKTLAHRAATAAGCVIPAPLVTTGMWQR